MTAIIEVLRLTGVFLSTIFSVLIWREIGLTMVRREVISSPATRKKMIELTV